MTIGPVAGLVPFYVAGITAMRRGNRVVLNAYLWHGAGLLSVAVWLVHVAKIPLWLYVACVHGSF